MTDAGADRPPLSHTGHAATRPHEVPSLKERGEAAPLLVLRVYDPVTQEARVHEHGSRRSSTRRRG